MGDVMADVRCSGCGRRFVRRQAEVARHAKLGMREFCGRQCFGLSRRVPKAVKVQAKASYDRNYRARNRAALKARKAAYFARTYDPAVARIQRRKRAKFHVEYCRRYYADPARKAAKVAYDFARRASAYAEYAEAYRLLVLLTKEIRKRACAYERRRERGYYTRSAQQRRRDAQASRW